MTIHLNKGIGLYGTLTRLMLVLIMSVCLIVPAMAQSTHRVSVKIEKGTLRSALEQLKKETKMPFLYDESRIDLQKQVSLSYTKAPLNVVLDDICKQTSLRYEIKPSFILILPLQKGGKSNDLFTIKGVVRDEENEPIIGATVSIGGTSKGTQTNINGEYRIEAEPGDILIFSYIGSETQAVKVAKGKATVNVDLKPNETLLEEVIVTGYQTLSKERATGSYAVLSDKDTKGKLETDVMSRIEGLVAGVNSTKNGTSDIVIRGITTINGARNPLYIVDGMPYEGDISAINPSDIQNVTVLKDAAASSIYGARAANGVIVLTTKRGQAGKTSIGYNGSIQFSPVPNVGYLNMMSSSELVDMQIEGFNYYHLKYANLDARRSVNPVTALLYEHEAGKLSDDELSSQLEAYRNRDNRQQIMDELTRTGIVHQHNISLSGGNEKNRYIATINYLGNYGNQKFRTNERIGFSIKDDVKFFDWMSADFGVTGSFVRSSGDNGVPSYLSLMTNYPSYFMLRDESNNPLAFQRYKSAMEIDRLKSIGLLDETYVPVDEIHRSRFTNDRNYYRLHAGMTFELAQGLNLDLKYQTENTFSTDRTIIAANSYSVRNMVNDAAQYNTDTQEITYNIPTGEQLSESRSVDYSYTLRAQMNFNREFDERHAVTALAGAERRLVRSTGTSVYYMGYDDNSLAIKPFNPLALDNLEGTEALSGFYNWQYADYNKLYHTEDRFVSFYANASYTFDNCYSITGSVRMDQSNLFGTDPKYQYRPLWSLGASWYLGNEEFMKNISWIDLLNLRLTSGVGGNVPKGVGPYINVVSTGYLSWINAFGNSISYPPNSRLRWEKTVSNNIGIDFALFNSRVSGSIDLYHKSTTDLLGARNADPTLGWKTLTVNYGAMINKGVELSLQTVNVKSRNFSWSTNMMFGYNHNRLTNLTGTEQSVFTYVAYDVQAVGYPVNSLFSYRYAGLDPKNGSVMVYNGQDQKASGVSSVDELVYSGTRDPKYTASLKNTLSFGDFDLSFMFVYYGGHVMRDVVADYLTGAPSTNINRKALNHWRKAGDELIEGMAPAFNRSANYTRTQVWYSSDIHVKKADYIKLRDVSLSYTLPKKWLRPLSLTNAVLTCQVRDLWWWAANGDIDPEAYSTDSYGRGQLNLPNPTTYTFGISLNF